MSAILTASSDDGERRQTERKPLSVRVRFTPTGCPEMEVRSVDISTTGMSVVSDLNLAASTACNVAFSLPQGDGTQFKVALSARVAHSTYSGQRMGFVNGLQFKNVPAETQAALTRYVKG
jgi:c-di-GMP-binding flagellar brake protein YcgR